MILSYPIQIHGEFLAILGKTLKSSNLSLMYHEILDFFASQGRNFVEKYFF